MIKRLAVLLVVAGIAGCGDSGDSDGRPESVPNAAGIWRESAAAIQRNDCTGFTVPPVAACSRVMSQRTDDVGLSSQCDDGAVFQGGIGLDGHIEAKSVSSFDLPGRCSVEIETHLDFFACDVGANNSSESDALRLMRLKPSGDCSLPPTCIGGSARGRACTTNADCPGNGRCNVSVCVGGDNDNLACTGDEGCPNGFCSSAVCAGGTNDGTSCASNADCPDGECNRPVCIGGTDDGQACESDDDCPAGECNATINSCIVVMASTWTRRPGTCFGGANDGRPCVGAADCRPGTCVSTVCGGGAREGLACTNGGNCPVACVPGGAGSTCAGGARDGESCTVDTDCTLFECRMATPALRFCNTGVRSNLACTVDTDCPCDDEITPGNCPSGRCAARNSCSGGINVNAACNSANDCPVFACGSSFCDGGSGDGQPCTTDVDCGGGSCVDRPFCEGGTEAGRSCDGDGDCPGGACVTQARTCSHELSID
ncbi:MAG TPA: hypothetical protein VEB21_19035 [Terriglobales bacterium]|nr:hypothetical protein [Terriglobales bacterium]